MKNFENSSENEKSAESVLEIVEGQKEIIMKEAEDKGYNVYLEWLNKRGRDALFAGTTLLALFASGCSRTEKPDAAPVVPPVASVKMEKEIEGLKEVIKELKEKANKPANHEDVKVLPRQEEVKAADDEKNKITKEEVIRAKNLSFYVENVIPIGKNNYIVQLNSNSYYKINPENVSGLDSIGQKFLRQKHPRNINVDRELGNNLREYIVNNGQRVEFDDKSGEYNPIEKKVKTAEEKAIERKAWDIKKQEKLKEAREFLRSKKTERENYRNNTLREKDENDKRRGPTF